MPREVPIDLPSPELHEPYEGYLYAQLRHEISLRHIRLIRTGPQRVTRRTGFISLLRDWDVAHGNQTSETEPTQTKNQTQPKPSQKKKLAMTPTTRTVRARRGCRFRLINVLLSPDFHGRWGEMAVGGKLEVTPLWLDVHAAYMAQNSMLDTLHFEDALFVNVTPNVVLAHSASRLLQMWAEILAMYRSAVAQARDAAAHNDNVHSFFDFCAGRLDLLYLHMAMLLEPKLSELIMTDVILASDSSGRAKAKPAVTPVLKEVKTTVKAAASKAQAATKAVPATKPATRNAEVVLVPARMSAVLTQNPEMAEPPTPADAKSTAVTAPSKSVAAKPSKSSAKAKQVTRKPVGQKKAAGKNKLTIGAAEAKPKQAPTQQKHAATPPKPKTPTIFSHKKSPPGNGSTHTRLANGKRQREEEVSTAIVAVPTVGPVSDIVPHSGNKRVNTTTTISTLATRPTDMILPPDEWDILENRLRKVNENIDRCHHGLASNEGNVSDIYKQSLEADLRFYSAIKQRLQEQLLVVMQSGY
uniref:Uncharacterized protein n=1 Tax=Phytophthora ramorum TaxID=164328 RepID=H3GP88_PHYRM